MPPRPKFTTAQLRRYSLAFRKSGLPSGFKKRLCLDGMKKGAEIIIQFMRNEKKVLAFAKKENAALAQEMKLKPVIAKRVILVLTFKLKQKQITWQEIEQLLRQSRLTSLVSQLNVSL